MLVSLFAAIAILMALMLGWIEVQRMARRVAAEHPEAGPLRLVGGGCGGQGHGDKAQGDKAQGESASASRASPARMAAKIAEKSAEGCAACDNIACKPGLPAAQGDAEPQPLH